MECGAKGCGCNSVKVRDDTNTSTKWNEVKRNAKEDLEVLDFGEMRTMLNGARTVRSCPTRYYISRTYTPNYSRQENIKGITHAS
jgi:hypothetical protein